jgi:hypothetical protein
MNRQAMVVFAAIVAVGIGPALWVGSTLFRDEGRSGTPVPVGTLATVAPTPTATASVTEPEASASSVPPTSSPEPDEPAVADDHEESEGLDPDGLWTPGMKVREPVLPPSAEPSNQPRAVG